MGKFNLENGSTNNVVEYSRTAMVIHDDIAVANYYYFNGVADKKGKQKVTYGCCSDVLVKGKDE